MLKRLTLHRIKSIEVRPPRDRKLDLDDEAYQIADVVFTNDKGDTFIIESFSHNGPLEIKHGK